MFLLQVIFIILKFAGILNTSWLIVFLPLIISVLRILWDVFKNLRKVHNTFKVRDYSK